MKLDWAYSPGEFKILLSADGANFAEAACWRAAARSDVAYAEYVMFEAPVAVAAVTVVMRQPRAWGYFGLNSASMIALPGPSLVVSGATSPSELCLVGASDLHLTPPPCLPGLAKRSSYSLDCQLHLASSSLLRMLFLRALMIPWLDVDG